MMIENQIKYLDLNMNMNLKQKKMKRGAWGTNVERDRDELNRNSEWIKEKKWGN